MILISTVVSTITFMLGLERVGGSTASIVSTIEPAVTVTLAALTFGERLTPLHLAGGVLVLAGVVVLSLRRPDSVEAGAPPDHAAPAPAARSLAQQPA